MDQINSNADRIATTVQSRYMPIGNLTGMTDEERALVATWYAQQQNATSVNARWNRLCDTAMYGDFLHCIDDPDKARRVPGSTC